MYSQDKATVQAHVFLFANLNKYRDRASPARENDTMDRPLLYMGKYMYKRVGPFGIYLCIFLYANLCWIPILAARGITHVVAVGVSDYQCINDLRLAQQDAKAIASYYRQAIPDEQTVDVHLLTNQNATKERVLKLL